MIVTVLLAVASVALALRLSDLHSRDSWEIATAASPLSAPFNISSAALVLPMGRWDSCSMDERTQGKVVLVTMVRSPCTIPDWLAMCQQYHCLGLVLHTFYQVPGLVLSHRIDSIPISEVCNDDGKLVNDLLVSGRQLSVSMDSFQPNEWVQYFESREFIWAMTLPASAAACIGVLNLIKLKEKMGSMLTWRSIPLSHISLVIAESVELGFRSALGFGLGTTQGKGFSFEHMIWLLNLIIVIYTMSNLTLGLALRDVYYTLIKQKPPLNAYLKLVTFILCSIIFVLHYVYNIIPRTTGNDQWRLPIIGQIWAALVVGTVALFLVTSVKLIISFRNAKNHIEDNNWLLKQISVRLLHCAMTMALDALVLAGIAIWTYHSSPRLLLMSLSGAAWSQNVTSVLKMRAILVPALPKKNRQNCNPVETDAEEDRSSKYLAVIFDENTKLKEDSI